MTDRGRCTSVESCMRTSSIRLFNRLCLMAGLLLLVSAQSFAQHAASNYVRVSNDGVNTDRFHDPEYAAWLSIERYNARSGTAASYYIFDHIEANFGATFENWRVYYNHMKDGVLTGPHFYGSSVIRYFVCDYTPLIGPSYGSDVQGLPRGQSSNPMTYATGCPVPQGIVDKNPCLSHCDGNPINVGMMNKVQVERDLEEGGGLLFERRYNSIGFHYGAMLWYPTLGALWQHNFDRSIQLYTSSSGLSTAAALRPDGRILKFTLTSGIWTPDADVVDGLQRLVDGSGNPVGWSYTTAERNVETYGIDGRLNLITLRGGTTLTLSYSTSA